jgi:hypothetical protein
LLRAVTNHSLLQDESPLLAVNRFCSIPETTEKKLSFGHLMLKDEPAV